jgi:hypothetical protein
MVHCNKYHAAMQTNELPLASGIPMVGQPRSVYPQQGDDMSKTATFGLAPAPTIFGRLMATIDRLLMASARIAIRNGDLPYSGL